MSKGEIKYTAEQQAALEYSDHISLTANAGSGKTFILTRRYIDIALHEDIQLRNMAAITFSEKAAGELYKKITERTEELLAETDDTSLIERLEKIRRQLISANIQTIHSFCADLLREYPVEAGIDANFKAIDERESAELIELAVEDSIRKLLKNEDSAGDCRALIRNAGSVAKFSSTMKSLVRSRNAIFSAAENIYGSSIEKTTENYHKIINDYSTLIINGMRSSFIANLRSINDRAGEFPHVDELLEKLEKADTGEFFEIVRQLSGLLLTKSGTVKKSGYLAGKDREGLEGIIRQTELDFKTLIILEAQPDDETGNMELAAFGHKFLRVFQTIAENYEVRKRNHGMLDFEDLLLLSGDLLANADVRKALTERYKFIMIDEYQDTNQIQYDIFLPILDYLKEGNLFVVGDEKQSIYGFRDADLAVFERTKTDIMETSGEEQLKTLPASFRMAPPLCAFTNHIFRELFANPQPLFNEVKAADLISAKADELQGGIEILLSPQENDETGESPLAEYELVARRILKLIHNPDPQIKLGFKDIAVLCRKRKSFAELEQTFFNYGIPYTVVGGTGFYQRQIIYDIYNYLAFLLNNGNDTALAGVLRSPFFSFSDADLFEISRQRGDSFFDKLTAAAQSNSACDQAVQLLKENSILSAGMPIVGIIRKITTETPFLSVLAARPDGQQELANFEKLLELTISYTNTGFRNLYDFVSFLGDAIESYADEGQAAVEQDTDSVKIMTMHQAKGLEYKAVFLYNSHESAMSGSVKASDFVVHKDFGILAKVRKPDDYFGDVLFPPIVRLYNYIEKRRNFAELKRLFYVAVTRAKNYLFITGKSMKDDKFGEDTFLNLLLAGLSAENLPDAFSFSEQVDRLDLSGDEASTGSITVPVVIPVISEIEQSTIEASREEQHIKTVETAISPVADTPSGEIISATKLAVFSQCPVKYQLTYEFGYQKVYRSYKEWLKSQSGQFDFKFREDKETEEGESAAPAENITRMAAMKGEMIHTILEKNIPDEDLSSFITQKYFAAVTPAFRDKSALERLSNDIIEDINRFRNSPVFKEINAHENYKNEFSMYAALHDFFLFGIADKIIDKGKELIIVDYKTDSIDEKTLNKRVKHYLIQMTFYAYIAGLYFGTKKDITLMLLFIKHPGIPFVKKISAEELHSLEEKVTEMVSVIRKRSFTKNRNHCFECTYSSDGKTCILD